MTGRTEPRPELTPLVVYTPPDPINNISAVACSFGLIVQYQYLLLCSQLYFTISQAVLVQPKFAINSSILINQYSMASEALSLARASTTYFISD